MFGIYIMAGWFSRENRGRVHCAFEDQTLPMKNMVWKTLDETLSYCSQSLTLHGMRGEFCPACGEGVWDTESYRRYAEAQAALLRSVSSDISSEIRRIRKGLKLTQAQLAEAFGIGKAAFSRYERGETRPPAPLVKLLKLLERHPDLLKEMD